MLKIHAAAAGVLAGALLLTGCSSSVRAPKVKPSASSSSTSASASPSVSATPSSSPTPSASATPSESPSPTVTLRSLLSMLNCWRCDSFGVSFSDGNPVSGSDD